MENAGEESMRKAREQGGMNNTGEKGGRGKKGDGASMVDGGAP